MGGPEERRAGYVRTGESDLDRARVGMNKTNKVYIISTVKTVDLVVTDIWTKDRKTGDRNRSIQ